MKNILFIIRRYAATDGASQALYGYIKSNPQIKDYLIISRWVISSQEGLNIKEVCDWTEIREIIKSNNFDLIHYYKTAYYDIFNWAVKAISVLDVHLPIITTVCQKPSVKGLLLSPNEIHKSNAIVLIDKSAFNDPIIGFIPNTIRKQIYFGTTDAIISKTEEYIKSASTSHNSEIIFGRGSTLSKCPRDLIEVFKKIKYKNKRFVIAGIPQNNWIEKLVKKENNIEIVGIKPFDEWLKICSSFDIFLYQLPKTSHSSIDGTLGQAMLLQKAVIYYGPDAPRERLVDGENALVAESINQIPELCDKLALDPELRKRLGENARKSTLRNFTIHTSVERYNKLYDEVLNITGKVNIPIPVRYYYEFYRTCWKHVLKSRLGGSWIEQAHFKRHPLK